MQGISLLLERWKNFSPPDETVKNAVVKIVEDMIGVTLPKTAISVRNGIVHIATDSTVKAELFMRRVMLEKTLCEALCNKKTLGIR